MWISLPAGVPELGDCGFCGLSIDHEVIPLDRHDLSEDLPMVSGIRVKATQVPEPYHKWCDVKVQKALSLYKTLTLADSSSALLLSEINVTDVANPVLYLLPNTKVMMGEGDLERKWMRVRTILAGVEDIGSFSCLDLRFDDQVLLARSSSAESNLRAGKRAKSSQGK